MVDLHFASRKQAFIAQRDLGNFKFADDINVKLTGLVNAIPILVLFDYASTFPSVAHEWMLLVLKAIRIPYGILNIVRARYADNDAFSDSSKVIVWLFKIVSSVLQGCPLSGSLFVIVIDPLLF